MSPIVASPVQNASPDFSGSSARDLELPAVPLGIYARNSSKASVSRSDTLLNRFALQATARSILPRERVATCLRRPIPAQSYGSVSALGDRRLVGRRGVVDVLYAPVAGQAHYGGLQVCGSVWLCPVCAAKISEKRRLELSAAVSSWLISDELLPRRTILVTLTLQHKLGNNLSVVLDWLKTARKGLVSGRWSREFATAYGLVGSVRALEITYGRNGWHPHMHILMFFDRDLPILPFTDDISSRWSYLVSRAGGYANLENGCDVRYSDADIADYVAKFGREPKWTAAHELTKQVVKISKKGGSTPLELLRSAMWGDTDAARHWLEYAVNFKGQRQLFWSQGLRRRLGLLGEKTDEELALEQDTIAIILAELTYEQWRVILLNDARADLLNVASSGDTDMVWGFLAALGVEHSKI